MISTRCDERALCNACFVHSVTLEAMIMTRIESNFSLCYPYLINQLERESWEADATRWSGRQIEKTAIEIERKPGWKLISWLFSVVILELKLSIALLKKSNLGSGDGNRTRDFGFQVRFPDHSTTLPSLDRPNVSKTRCVTLLVKIVT